ncbi:hypothetical protein [Cypionkella sp.]|uniref:hypothetical protein n=1 Tax=Cypionkella sp. TaxID=2811411 RepID=UPI002ABCBB09|nr:hypothetical protein [Cypionkella sp.]MDZ4394263.1 hypothetical protein [Cypionkella sp.]
MGNGAFIRPIITKFFKEADLPFYKKGNFQFGTLQRYRKLEGSDVEARFRDVREGVPENDYNFISGCGFSGVVGDNVFKNCNFAGPGAAIAVRHEINEHVICFCRGPYSSQQHSAMREGAANNAGTMYEGDLKLTHFAEIDWNLFLKAVSAKLKETGSEEDFGGDPILYGHIGYGDTKKSSLLGAQFDIKINGVSQEDYMRTIFTKPDYFSPENEHRIVLRKNFPFFLEADSEPLNLCSKQLRRSIVRIGSVPA